MNSPEAEHQELERAVDLLGRSTRHARLLAFLGEKYFQRQGAQLTEYVLATEFFGRSPKRFDASQDAVVRVEVHRLRKKLREIYERAGGASELQVSLPAGTYVPQFSTARESVESAREPELEVSPDKDGASEPEEAQDSSITASIGHKRAWLYLLVALSLCAAIFVAIVSMWPRAAHRTQPNVSQDHPNVPNIGETPAAEVHLMAGYSGSDVIDSSGVRWTPDRFSTGGGPWPSAGRFVLRTSRPFLFANWRNGDFGYDIPVKPGSYELRLFFVSPLRVGEEKLIGFNVSLGGKPLLTAFDVNIDAHGADVADEKVFRDVAPDDDGFIRLRFTNQVDKPWLNALEIVPGISGKQRPTRISTQLTSFVDNKGQRWRADDYFLNGIRSTDNRTVTGTDDPELFGAERYGHFSYAIPVDTRGRYTVILHFAEFYFGPQLQAGGGVGSRIFHVFCNGNSLLENFDIYKEAGSLRVVTKTFSNIKPSAQGKINLTFEPVVNNATISGIEVVDESD